MTHSEKTIARILNEGNAIVRSTVSFDDESGLKYYAVDDLVEQKTLHIPVSEITLYFLTADTTNGVQTGNEEDVATDDPMRQEDFYHALRSLCDSRCICSYVTHQMLDRINNVYGVN